MDRFDSARRKLESTAYTIAILAVNGQLPTDELVREWHAHRAEFDAAFAEKHGPKNTTGKVGA